ncbi:MAG: ATP synthase F1 subunit delta [Fimbriimonadaceae bacterium]|nr:ATP synthase F1 subunit delta [Fimbriimonadaceae bacterium]
MDVRVARRYAEALYSVAKQDNTIQAVEDDLNGVVGMMENDQRFRSLVLSPTFDRGQKLQVLEKAFSDRVTALTMQALRILVQKRREAELAALRDEFVRIRREQGKVMYTNVTSAEALTADQQKRLIDQLASQTGKTVEATFDVDKALIGGIRVSYDNYVLDGSVRGGLNRLRESLKRDLLKQA